MAIRFTESIDDIIITQNVVYTPNYIILPEAIDGRPPYIYSITPGLPEGISFIASSRRLILNPTHSLNKMSFAYQAQDFRGQRRAIIFNITITDDRFDEDDVDRDNAIIETPVETQPTYITVEGENLSGIIFRNYGYVNDQILNIVYENNPTLTQSSLVLPVGTIVRLPNVSTDAIIAPVPLWS